MLPDERLALLRVEGLALLDGQGVVLGVRPEGLVQAADLVGGEAVERLAGVVVGAPVPDGQIEVGLPDVARVVVDERRELADVEDREPDLETELAQPAGDELGVGLAGGVVGRGVEPQGDGLALPVQARAARAQPVAGLGEELAGLGQVEGVELAGRRLPVVVGVGEGVRRDDGGSRCGEAAVGDRAQLLAVDRVVQGVAEPPVAQHGVAQRARLVVAVELEVVPVVVVVGDRLEALRGGERLLLGLGVAPGAVETAGLQVGDHRVGVLVELEVDLVDGRLLAVPVGVADHLDVAALDEGHGLEGAAADDRRLVDVACGRRPRRNVRPDVLGQDRHAGLLEVGLGRRADDPHRRRVEGRHRLDAGRVVGEVGHVVLDDVGVGEGDVGGGQGLPVLPPDARAQVDRPDLAVRRDAAVLLGRELGREVERRLVVVAAAEELRVVQGPDLVGVVRVADERVEVVGLGRPAEAQDDLGGGRGAAAGGERRGQAPDEAAGQERDQSQGGQGST